MLPLAYVALSLPNASPVLWCDLAWKHSLRWKYKLKKKKKKKGQGEEEEEQNRKEADGGEAGQR